MLLESRMKPFVILDTVTVPDGFGGYDEVLADGAPFDAAAVIKSNTEALIAYQNGVKKIYSVGKFYACIFNVAVTRRMQIKSFHL